MFISALRERDRYRGVVKVVADVVLVLPDKLERDGHLFFLPEGKRIRAVRRVGAIQAGNLGFR